LIEIFTAGVFIRKLDEIGRKMEEEVVGVIE